MTTGKKAIFLDIDGTLLYDDRLPPVREDIEALREARAAGHLVFINTGRSRGCLPGVLRDIDWADGYMMGCGTHFMLASGETVYRACVPAEALRAATAAFLRDEERYCIFEGEDALYGTRPRAGRLPVDAQRNFDTCYRGAAITKLTVIGPFRPGDRALLGEWFEPVILPHYYEVILKGFSKGRGIARACAAFHVPVENALAIGDSENDLDMIACAGVGVAMGNACPALKAIADAVTLPCGQGGVGQAVREWVLRGDARA